MSDIRQATTVPAVVLRPAARRPGAGRRFLRSPVAVVSCAILLLAVVAAVFAPLLAPSDPNDAQLSAILAPVSSAHPLGGDSAGRDVFSRILYGARFSLGGAVVALAVAAVLGIPAGILAGYVRGGVDHALRWVTSLVLALPGLVVLLAFRSVVGPSMWGSMVVFGALLAPSFFRLTETAVSGIRSELYIDAAHVAGLSDLRILTRHVLGVVRPPIIVQSAIVAGTALTVQASLDFLGLGDPSVPTWGTMLNEGFRTINTAPRLTVWPALAVALVTAAFFFVADAGRDAVQASTTGRRTRLRRVAPTKARTPAPVEVDDDHLLRVRDLEVTYVLADGTRRTVVHDVSLDVRRGRVLGLVGESGSGKSQTAFSILGLLPSGGQVTGGSIRFGGQELLGLDEASLGRLRGQRIAYVPQEPLSNLDPTFTIGSQMVEQLRVVGGRSRRDAERQALDLLARVGIKDPQRTMRSYPHEISGGMAQRVLIAKAISCDPELLIADEPTTALDVTVQAEVLDLLRDLMRERSMGVVFVTHNFGVVADICDDVAVMSEGRVVETRPVDDLFADPRHDYTRMLLGSMIGEGATRPPLARREGRQS